MYQSLFPRTCVSTNFTIIDRTLQHLFAVSYSWFRSRRQYYRRNSIFVVTFCSRCRNSRFSERLSFHVAGIPAGNFPSRVEFFSSNVRIFPSPNFIRVDCSLKRYRQRESRLAIRYFLALIRDDRYPRRTSS